MTISSWLGLTTPPSLSPSRGVAATGWLWRTVLGAPRCPEPPARDGAMPHQPRATTSFSFVCGHHPAGRPAARVRVPAAWCAALQALGPSRHAPARGVLRRWLAGRGGQPRLDQPIGLWPHVADQGSRTSGRCPLDREARGGAGREMLGPPDECFVLRHTFSRKS